MPLDLLPFREAAQGHFKSGIGVQPEVVPTMELTDVPYLLHGFFEEPHGQNRKQDNDS